MELHIETDIWVKVAALDPNPTELKTQMLEERRDAHRVAREGPSKRITKTDVEKSLVLKIMTTF